MHSLLIGIYFLVSILFCVACGLSAAFFICIDAHSKYMRSKNPLIGSQLSKMPNLDKCLIWSIYSGLLFLFLIIFITCALIPLMLNAGINEAWLTKLFILLISAPFWLFIIFYVVKLRHWVKKTLI